MKIFVSFRRIWLGMFLLYSTVQAGQSGLIGEWQFVESSFPLPESCRSTIFHFAANGVFLARDGRYEERKRYAEKSHREGFLVEFQYLSNNGQKNCQGLPANYVRTNTIETLYVQVMSTTRIKVYFGPAEMEHFIIFARRNDK